MAVTRYYIRASTELLAHRKNWREPDGWRLVREVGPIDQYTVLCEVEDDNAPAELAGHVVQIVMEGRYAQDGTQTAAVVSDRWFDEPFDTGFQVAYRVGYVAAAQHILDQDDGEPETYGAYWAALAIAEPNHPDMRSHPDLRNPH